MPADECRFHSGHLWCHGQSREDLRVGISDYAQQSLGEIVYFDLPEVGSEVTAGEPMGTVESIKVVNDLIAPVSGRVIEANASIADTPSLANDDPYGAGWLVRIHARSVTDLDGLMDYAAYQDYTGD